MINEFKSEIVSSLIGAFFSAFMIAFKKMYHFIKHHYHIFKLKQTNFVFDENLNIYTIENAIPRYEELNIIPSSKKLFVDIPDDYKPILSKSHSFHENISFDGTSSFRDLSIQTGIYDLEKLISIHSKRVAENFLNGSAGCKFNEIKYGVLDIDIGRRVGQQENPVATITTFETDFFTYRVFCSIYNELKNRGHEISKIVTLADLIKYNCFVCSIGLNVIACIDSPKYNRDEILFTRRSNNAINYQNMYHISVNEGMCYMDYNPSTGHFDLENCLFRGIEEELGIPRNYHLKNKTDYQFWDLFISKDTFDFCITCSVKIHSMYFEDIRSLLAKDKQFEIDKLESIIGEKKLIEEYVSNRVFIPQGLYTLNSYFIRKFGRAIEVPRKKIR